MSGGGGGGGDGFAEEPEAHENHERYLLTYADMITLLMALFIILFAIGQTDIAKFKSFQTGLQKEFGAPALDGGTGVLDGSQMEEGGSDIFVFYAASPGLVNSHDLEDEKPQSPLKPEKPPVEITAGNADPTAATIAQVLATSGIGATGYEVDVDDRGVVIRLSTDEVTFVSGSWNLRPESARPLQIVARALSLVSNEIIVEGHTDSRPMTPPMTNWELSAARASTVVRHFIDVNKMAPTRLQVAGYADTRPIAPNETDQGRARNRRVEIVILLRTDATPTAAKVAITPAMVNPARPAPVDPMQVTKKSTVSTTTPKKPAAAGH
jgi:chemotaxis protein MotB